MSGNFSEDTDSNKKNNNEVNWEESFITFTKKMRNKIIRNIWRKGYPTKERLNDCSEDYLIKKLNEHLELKHYSDVANFAFMLAQKNGDTE